MEVALPLFVVDENRMQDCRATFGDQILELCTQLHDSENRGLKETADSIRREDVEVKEMLVRCLIQQLVVGGRRFEDPYFPPFPTSISNLPSSQQVSLQGSGTVAWKRPFLIGELTAVVAVLPSDASRRCTPLREWVRTLKAEPGQLLLYTALSECILGGGSNMLLEDLLIFHGIEQGVYGVKLFVNNRWCMVIIDDLFPCKRDGGSNPKFVDSVQKGFFACQHFNLSTIESRSPDSRWSEKEIWPLILEKAWAKCHSTYEKAMDFRTTFTELHSAQEFTTAISASQVALLQADCAQELALGSENEIAQIISKTKCALPYSGPDKTAPNASIDLCHDCQGQTEETPQNKYPLPESQYFQARQLDLYVPETSKNIVSKVGSSQNSTCLREQLSDSFRMSPGQEELLVINESKPDGLDADYILPLGIGSTSSGSTKTMVREAIFPPEQYATVPSVLEFDSLDSAINGTSNFLECSQRYENEDLQTIFDVIHEKKLAVSHNDVHVKERLASGAFGSIFKALFNGGLVVLKKIDEANNHDDFEQIMKDFRMELFAIASLSHPNIVELKGVLTSHDRSDASSRKYDFGFLMEYCENGSVFNNLFKKGTLKELSLRLAISCQVASGMAYMHDQNFIHQDLNTQNVVLTREMVGKICDFGSARKLGDCGYIITDMIEGTPSSMSPEQLSGGKLSCQSDVWQMGVFLWEVFAMQQAWVGVCDIHDLVAMTDLVVKRKVRLPALDTRQFGGILSSVSDLIQQSFEFKAELRPRMSEMHTALSCIYQGHPRLEPKRECLFALGEEVEYLSSTYQEWIDATVLAFNSDGSLDLDVKSNVHVSKVRRKSLSSVPSGSTQVEPLAVSKHQNKQRSEDGPSMPSTSHLSPRDLLKIGSEVEYYSSSYGEWISAKVIKLNPDGTLDLDVKQHVAADLVRFAISESSSQHPSLMDGSQAL